jgi:hypothetical protein
MTMRDLIKYGFTLDDQIYITVKLYDKNGFNHANEELAELSIKEFMETCDGDIILFAERDDIKSCKIEAEEGY